MKKSWSNNLFPAAVALALAGATACADKPKEPAQTSTPVDTVKTQPVTIGPAPTAPDTLQTETTTLQTTSPKGVGSGNKPAASTGSTKQGSGGASTGGSGGKTAGQPIQPPPKTENIGPGRSVKHHSPDDQRLDSLKKAKTKRKE